MIKFWETVNEKSEKTLFTGKKQKLSQNIWWFQIKYLPLQNKPIGKMEIVEIIPPYLYSVKYSPGLRTEVFRRIDQTLAYMKREGITEQEDLLED